MAQNTEKIALVTGADRGLGLSVAKGLLRQGWRVLAGKFLQEYGLLEDTQREFPNLTILPLDVSDPESIRAAAQLAAQQVDHIDLLVSNAAFMGGQHTEFLAQEPFDFAMLEKFFKTNSLAAPLLVSEFLPLLEKGSLKRLCFVSSEISSVRLQRRVGDTGYAMSKTSLNLGVRMIWNTLRPKGYTFRLYQPGWMKRMQPDGSLAERAIVDPADSAAELLRQTLSPRIDEHRLVLTDYMGHEVSF